MICKKFIKSFNYLLKSRNFTEANVNTRNCENFPLNEGVTLLNCENGILALHKPVNIISHPNNLTDINKSLIKCKYDIKSESFKLPNGREIWLCNRLDSATSGVIILCTNFALANFIKNQFKLRLVEKTYIAMVFGDWKHHEVQWNDVINISNTSSSKHYKTKPIKAGKCLVLKHNIKLDDSVPKTSLLELYPLTGLTHQLRYQCNLHGYPIVGDKLYGSFTYNKIYCNNYGNNRLFLHSKDIFINYVLDNNTRVFKASSPIPLEFYHHYK